MVKSPSVFTSCETAFLPRGRTTRMLVGGPSQPVTCLHVVPSLVSSGVDIASCLLPGGPSGVPITSDPGHPPAPRPLAQVSFSSCFCPCGHIPQVGMEYGLHSSGPCLLCPTLSCRHLVSFGNVSGV